MRRLITTAPAKTDYHFHSVTEDGIIGWGARWISGKIKEIEIHRLGLPATSIEMD